MKKLSRSYYQNPDVIRVARSLIGKRLMTRLDRSTTGGIITETEAYCGMTDRASHAYKGRRTPRTEVMYAQGGTAYVYLCYGMHALFNVVTNAKDIPHAILIRSIQPDTGLNTVKKRRDMKTLTPRLTCGPGNLAQALGIRVAHTGTDLTGDSIWIEETDIKAQTVSAKRIGVDYAGADAAKPWRFLLRGSKWVSHPPTSSVH